MSNVHDKVFVCPKCGNKTLYPINGNKDIIGIGEECAAELWSEPQFDNSVKFVDIPEE